MPSQSRVLRCGADFVASMAPFIAAAPLLPEGIFLGYELGTGRPVYMDFQLLKKYSLIHSAIVMIVGAKDHGKSALVKTLALRLMMLQAGIDPGTKYPLESRLRTHDRKIEGTKGEFSDTCDYLAGDNISLANVGAINPFDPTMSTSELSLVGTAINIAEIVRKRLLDEIEVLVLQIAVHHMYTRYREIMAPYVLELCLRKLTPGDVKAYFDSVDSTAVKEYAVRLETDPDLLKRLYILRDRTDNYSAGDLQEAGARVAAIYGRMLRADFGPLFTGTGSLRRVLSAPVVNFDWSGVTGPAQELLEFLMNTWQLDALNKGDSSLMPTINVSDEEASALKSLAHARSVDDLSIKARAYQTTDLRLMQHLAGLRGIGADNSELRKLGENIDRNIGVRIIGRQENDPASMEALARLGMSDADMFMATTLERFCWGLVIPNQRVRWFQSVLFGPEVPLVETNSANKFVTNRMNVTTVKSLRQRSQRGIVQIGDIA